MGNSRLQTHQNPQSGKTRDKLPASTLICPGRYMPTASAATEEGKGEWPEKKATHSNNTVSRTLTGAGSEADITPALQRPVTLPDPSYFEHNFLLPLPLFCEASNTQQDSKPNMQPLSFFYYCY